MDGVRHRRILRVGRRHPFASGSQEGAAGTLGGGTGSCAGLVESGNLVLVSFPLDSLTVDNGLIRFVPQGSTYRFQGKVTANEMNGTMSASPYYPGVGVQVQTTGRWQAVREPTP